jgi:predicted NAD/FAD-dependent oxidoreductase
MTLDTPRAPIIDQKIAVVGAGCAGLTVARRLHDAGARVTVFDKGRSVGGRMATRRIGDRRFDHGAQFFTARGEAFRQQVEMLERRGALAPWPARWGHFDGARFAETAIDEQRFVGINGMSAVPQALAAGIDIVLDAEVTDLSRGKDRWILECATEAETAGFDAVILAVPSPQAVALLTGICDFAVDVAAATYAPCWAVMASFATRLPLAYDAVSLDDGMLRWAARNASKPGFAGDKETWVVHATPEWSLANIEESAETIRDILLEAFQQRFGITEAAVEAVAHRWRYALVVTSAEVPCFWDPILKIGACGDWCLGPRVEAAFDSGLALARYLLVPQP